MSAAAGPGRCRGKPPGPGPTSPSCKPSSSPTTRTASRSTRPRISDVTAAGSLARLRFDRSPTRSSATRQADSRPTRSRATFVKRGMRRHLPDSVGPPAWPGRTQTGQPASPCASRPGWRPRPGARLQSRPPDVLFRRTGDRDRRLAPQGGPDLPPGTRPGSRWGWAGPPPRRSPGTAALPRPRLWLPEPRRTAGRRAFSSRLAVTDGDTAVEVSTIN